MNAQTYHDQVALDRMADGLCPECGRRPEAHGSDPRFWLPGNQACSLLSRGVVERIAQFRADREPG